MHNVLWLWLPTLVHYHSVWQWSGFEHGKLRCKSVIKTVYTTNRLVSTTYYVLYVSKIHISYFSIFFFFSLFFSFPLKIIECTFSYILMLFHIFCHLVSLRYSHMSSILLFRSLSIVFFLFSLIVFHVHIAVSYICTTHLYWQIRSIYSH